MAKIPDRLLTLVAVFGVLNAALYCQLLPLWEGFDEPFHFGYAQTLAVRARVPVLGRAPISAEVRRSLELAPASHVVRQNLPFVTTFDDYAALPEAERRARRESLWNLPPRLRELESPGGSNYEAQQAPLAYLPLAAAEWLWRGDPLPARVVKLRLVGALGACLLQFWFTLTLARMLGLPRAARVAALFLVFSSQMFYAATAHVANDWLAIPLTTLVAIAALRFYRAPDRRGGALLGAAVAAGLLAKAYFLSWALFAGALVAWMLWRRRAAPAAAAAFAATVAVLAGPWYARNMLLYGSLSGMQQAAAGLGLRDVLGAVVWLPWGQALVTSARGAVWTGNNSFTAFSSATVDTVLWLLLAAAAVWLWTSRKAPARGAEWLLAVGCLCFMAAMVYAAALFYAYTRSGVFSATPWYPTALGAPLACLLCLGMARAGKPGRVLNAALCVGAAYIMGATYLVKLIPMYGGYGPGRITPARLWAWYGAEKWTAVLGDTALGDPSVILALAWAVALMAAGLGVAVSVRLLREDNG